MLSFFPNEVWVQVWVEPQALGGEEKINKMGERWESTQAFCLKGIGVILLGSQWKKSLGKREARWKLVPAVSMLEVQET